MKILLICPDAVSSIRFESVIYSKVTWGDSLSIPPLNLLYLASRLEQDGHLVKILDCKRIHASNNFIASIIRVEQPGLIGINVSSYTFHALIKLTRFLKQRHSIPIVVGGAHATLFPEECLRVKHVDYVIQGEGEGPLAELAGAIENGVEIESIENLGFKKQGQLIINPCRKVQDLDALPFPAYHLIDLNEYSYFFKGDQKYVVMVSSRGCPYTCAFCTPHASKYRQRSVGNVIKEMMYHRDRFGVQVVHFYDDCFTVNKKWVLEFVDALKLIRLDISWSCLARADCLDDELLANMSKAGCFLIKIGIESGDPGMLKRMDKKIPLKRMQDMVNAASKHGILTLGFFLVGAPGETKKTVQNTTRFILNSNLDYIRVARCVSMPRTKFYEEYLARGYPDYWKDIFNGKPGDFYTPFHDIEFSDEQLNWLVKMMHRRFYLRPKQAWKVIHQAPVSFERMKMLIKSFVAVLSLFLS